MVKKTSEARAFLNQVEKLDRIIENKLIEKEQWKAIAYGVTVQMNGERVQSSGSKQRMADAVDNLVDVEADLNRMIDELIDTKREVIKTIEKLNVTEYDLLHKVYIQRLTLQEVASQMKMSYSWATTTHGIALKNLQKILDERKVNGYE